MGEAACRLHALLRVLPPVRHALAYGSGVFEQAGAPPDPTRMVDYLLVVDEPAEWHAANLAANSSHYALLPRLLGGSYVMAVAQRVGVGVHFNPYVRAPAWDGDEHGALVKYGVVSTAAALDDLHTWSSLYLSGRLHKPVRHLVQDERVTEANAANLRSAATAALLLLPPQFDETQLHTALCGLSYTGDVRMALAEDRHKVRRLAESNTAALRRLYAPSLEGAPAARAALVPLHDTRWAQDDSPGARTEQVSVLPAGLLRALAPLVGLPVPALTSDGDIEGVDAWEVAHAAAHHREGVAAVLTRALHRVVAASSRRQSLAGALAIAGSAKGFRYLAAKVGKAWKTS